MENIVINRPSKRKKFNIFKSIMDLSEICPDLPDCECYKFISGGGFSSASFIALIASKTVIRHLYVSTFHIGKKEILLINKLHNEGRIIDADFVMFSKALETNSRYKYSKLIEEICANNRWSLKLLRNHSKIHLYDTDDGKYVIETSSNLNENPKIEQFSFEKDFELFNFYKAAIFD